MQKKEGVAKLPKVGEGGKRISRFLDITARMEELRVVLNLNKSRFARKIGVTPQTYHNFIGPQGSKPSVGVILGMVRNLGANPMWILNGEGEMFLPTPEKKGLEDNANAQEGLFVVSAEGVRPPRKPLQHRVALERIGETFATLRSEQVAVLAMLVDLSARYFGVNPAGALGTIDGVMARMERELSLSFAHRGDEET